jgi:hypothetical protein
MEGEDMSNAIVIDFVTLQRFSQIWPTQTDDFSTKMNRIGKLVQVFRAGGRVGQFCAAERRPR